MTKYNYEFKKKVVEDHLAGKGGYKYLVKKDGVSAESNVQNGLKIIWYMETKHV